MPIFGRMADLRDTVQTPGNMLVSAWSKRCELEIDVRVFMGACISILTWIGWKSPMMRGRINWVDLDILINLHNHAMGCGEPMRLLERCRQSWVMCGWRERDDVEDVECMT
jgi:hypothetical protein